MSLHPLSGPIPGVDPTTGRWFAEEVKPHEPRLRAWIARRFPELRDIDDVVQDAYVRLIRARNGRGVRSVQAFLFIAARNAAFDIFRRQPSELIEPLDNNVSAAEISENMPDAAEAAATKQELEILAEAMRTLPERCRQVYTLRKIFGLSQKEIAVRPGIAEHTVEAQINKGGRRCVEFLRARGITR